MTTKKRAEAEPELGDREDIQLPEPTTQTPRRGRNVDYVFSEADLLGFSRNQEGRTSYIGEWPFVGTVYPATIIEVQSDCVDLQVHLNGNENIWAPSRSEGTEEGTWAWPERV